MCVDCCLLLAAWCSLVMFDVRCSYLTCKCLECVARCLLCVVNSRLLFWVLCVVVGRCLLSVVCCVLPRVACCLLLVCC